MDSLEGQKWTAAFYNYKLIRENETLEKVRNTWRGWRKGEKKRDVRKLIHQINILRLEIEPKRHATNY